MMIFLKKTKNNANLLFVNHFLIPFFLIQFRNIKNCCYQTLFWKNNIDLYDFRSLDMFFMVFFSFFKKKLKKSCDVVFMTWRDYVTKNKSIIFGQSFMCGECSGYYRVKRKMILQVTNVDDDGVIWFFFLLFAVWPICVPTQAKLFWYRWDRHALNFWVSIEWTATSSQPKKKMTKRKWIQKKNKKTKTLND